MVLVIIIVVNIIKVSVLFYKLSRFVLCNMMLWISCRKWVSGSSLVIYCVSCGMFENGNMKLDSRIDGRKMKKVICIVWNCDCVCEEISSFSVRLLVISSSVVR